MINDKGKKYIEDINKKWKIIKNKKHICNSNCKKTCIIQFLFEQERNEYEKLTYENSKVQERIMRLGAEAKMYNLDTTNDLEQIAICSLREYFIGKYEKNAMLG